MYSWWTIGSPARLRALRRGNRSGADQDRVGLILVYLCASSERPSGGVGGKLRRQNRNSRGYYNE